MQMINTNRSDSHCSVSLLLPRQLLCHAQDEGVGVVEAEAEEEAVVDVVDVDAGIGEDAVS